MSNRAIYIISGILCAFVILTVAISIRERKPAEDIPTVIPPKVYTLADRQELAESLEMVFLNEMKMDTDCWVDGTDGKYMHIKYILMGRVMVNELTKSGQLESLCKKLGILAVTFSDGRGYKSVLAIEY